MNIRARDLALSTLFGLLMVAAVALPAGPVGRVIAGVALLAVLAGVRWRTAAVVAVLGCVACAALSGVPGLTCAAAGLAAAVYLVTRHAGALGLTPPAVAGLGFFAFAGLLPAVLPSGLRWAPLAVPAVVVAILALTAVLIARPGAWSGAPD